MLRVRALLRRANIEMERKITVGNLALDADAMSAEIIMDFGANKTLKPNL